MGLKTTLSEDAFLAICKAKREANSSGVPTYQFCFRCAGQTRPKELTIMDIKKEKQEGEVATDKPGECKQCGRQANLRNTQGKLVCPTCGMLRGMCSKRPEMVVEVLREFDSFPQGDGGGDVTAANKTIRKLREQLESATISLADATGKIGALEVKNDRLREAGGSGNGADHGVDLHALAWKFAEGMIYGDITGIDMEDLRMMRGEL